MHEVPKGVLHTKSYRFIKSPLVTNDMGNILRAKELLFVEGAGHEV